MFNNFKKQKKETKVIPYKDYADLCIKCNTILRLMQDDNAYDRALLDELEIPHQVIGKVGILIDASVVNEKALKYFNESKCDTLALYLEKITKTT